MLQQFVTQYIASRFCKTCVLLISAFYINQVFLPIVQVLGTYEEGNITKIVSCVSLTEMSLEEGNLTIAGTNIFPMVTEIKYENEEYEIINLNSAETVLANGSASFPEVVKLVR